MVATGFPCWPSGEEAAVELGGKRGCSGAVALEDQLLLVLLLPAVLVVLAPHSFGIFFWFLLDVASTG